MILVGTPGFEPGTSCAPCKHATRLRHVPTQLMVPLTGEVDNSFIPCGDALAVVAWGPLLPNKGA